MIPSQLPFLANHLWQTTLFVAAASLATLALRKNRAQTRSWVWLAASVKFLIPFSLLVDAGSHWAPHTAPPISTPRLSYVIEQASQPFALLHRPATIQVAVETSSVNWILAVLCAIWVLGSTTLTFSWWRQLRTLRAVLHGASAVDLHVGIEARTSPAFAEPGVFGIRRPFLLLPAGITDHLTPTQLEAIVAHELCHVRRRDNLAAAVHMGVEALFWFHPVVWWLGARLMDERERACDEEVLLMGIEPRSYAEGILKVCELYLESPLPCMSGITGANLTKRIEEIMSNRIGMRLSFGKKIALTTIGTAMLMVPMVVGILNPPAVQGQSPAAPLPKFEVASVKLHKPEAGPLRVSTSVESGRLSYANVTLKNCIRQAFGLRPYQISGGPGWLGDDRYDVVAKAAGPATKAQVMLMLQELLADRFKLTFHFEDREMPVYSLVAAKNGAKMKEVKDDGKGMQIGGDEHQLTARNISMAQFAGTLSRLQELDRPVMDRTGLKGVFNITLDFLAEDATSPDGTGPSIFTALPEQLGLKLEATKGPVQILVIDRVERPSEN